MNALSQNRHSFLVNWGLLFVVLFIFAVSRLLYLTRLPIFVDEGVHIWWGQRFLQGDIFRSLNVGRVLEPLFIAPGLLLGIEPLVWARVVHVIAGAVTLIFIFLVGKLLFSTAVGVLASLLYLVLPYAFFHDRIALTEVYVSMSSVLLMWSTAHANSRSQSHRWLYLTGGLLILGLLSKMPTGLILVLIPILFTFFLKFPDGDRLRNVRNFPVLYGPLIIVLMLCTAVIVWRLAQGASPGFGLTLSLRQSNELAVPALARMVVNISKLVKWLANYLTIPLFLLAIVAFVTAFGRRSGISMALTIFCLISISFFVVVADVWYPRYLFFITPALCLLTAEILQSLWQKIRTILSGRLGHLVGFIGLLTLLIPALNQDILLLIDPTRARLPDIDRYQYIEGPAAGYGFPETAAWLKSQDVAMVVQLLLGDYMQLTTYGRPPLAEKITQLHVVNGMSYTIERRLERLSELVAEIEPIWLVLPDVHEDILSQMKTYQLEARLLWQRPRPGSQTAITIYEIRHSKSSR